MEKILKLRKSRRSLPVPVKAAFTRMRKRADKGKSVTRYGRGHYKDDG